MSLASYWADRVTRGASVTGSGNNASSSLSPTIAARVAGAVREYQSREAARVPGLTFRQSARIQGALKGFSAQQLRRAEIGLEGKPLGITFLDAPASGAGVMMSAEGGAPGEEKPNMMPMLYLGAVVFVAFLFLKK